MTCDNDASRNVVMGQSYIFLGYYQWFRKVKNCAINLVEKKKYRTGAFNTQSYWDSMATFNKEGGKYQMKELYTKKKK